MNLFGGEDEDSEPLGESRSLHSGLCAAVQEPEAVRKGSLETASVGKPDIAPTARRDKSRTLGQ